MKREYTFTCDGCKKIFPMSKCSAMIGFYCRDCAIQKTFEDDEK